MNDFDLDRLARVWQEERPQAEIAWMEESAHRARRTARAALWVDAAIAVAVSAVVILLVAVSPATETMVAGAGAIALLFLTQRRQRRLRLVELQSLTGSTEEMLDQSIGRTRATLKRHWFSLIGIGPATLAGSLVAHYAQGRSSTRLIPTDAGAFWFLAGGALVVAAVLVHLIVAIRRSRAELERLEVFRESYKAEKE